MIAVILRFVFVWVLCKDAVRVAYGARTAGKWWTKFALLCAVSGAIMAVGVLLSDPQASTEDAAGGFVIGLLAQGMMALPCAGVSYFVGRRIRRRG
jgi:hypothetical protein